MFALRRLTCGRGKTAFAMSRVLYECVNVVAFLIYVYTNPNGIYKVNCKFAAFFLQTIYIKMKAGEKILIDGKYVLINFHPIFLLLSAFQRVCMRITGALLLYSLHIVSL